MTDKNKNNIYLNNSDSESTSSIFSKAGKRKWEYGDDNPNLKKMKPMSKNNNLSQVGDQTNNNPSLELIKTKVEKTALKHTAQGSKSVTLPKTGNNLLNKIESTTKFSKNKFADGLNKSMNLNAKKILEKENLLEKDLKLIDQKSEETKIKILNEFVIKNLNALELESLQKQEEEFQTLILSKKSNASDNIAMMVANREVWNINMAKSQTAIEEILKKKNQLKSYALIREEETKFEMENHQKLLLEETNISNMKVSINFDMSKIEDENKIIERKQKMINPELEKVLSKKNENYKNKTEALHEILVLKPFYKKFCIIRKEDHKINNFNNLSQPKDISIKIDNSRKFLSLMDHQNESKIKFDYITSLIDNPYEESKTEMEAEYINEEVSNILLSYLTKVNQSNDERDFLCLYINDRILNLTNNLGSVIEINTYLITLLKLLIKKVMKINEFSIEIKIGIDSLSYHIIEETGLNNYEDTSVMLDDLNIRVKEALSKLICETHQIKYLSFAIKNLKNKSSFRLFNLSTTNVDLTTNILSQFGNVNLSKRKNRSSKKKKQGQKEFKQIFEEMKFDLCYYFSTVLDFSLDSLKSSDVKEILLHV